MTAVVVAVVVAVVAVVAVVDAVEVLQLIPPVPKDTGSGHLSVWSLLRRRKGEVVVD